MAPVVLVLLVVVELSGGGGGGGGRTCRYLPSPPALSSSEGFSWIVNCRPDEPVVAALPSPRGGLGPPGGGLPLPFGRPPGAFGKSKPGGSGCNGGGELAAIAIKSLGQV